MGGSSEAGYALLAVGMGTGPAGESEFSDRGFVKVAEPEGQKSLVLVEGGLGEGEVETGLACQVEGNAGILGGVFRGEVAFMVALDHVGGIGFEDPGVGAGLAEDGAEGFGIESEGLPQPEPFCKGRGVAVHHHVDEGLDLGGASGFADIMKRQAEILQERLHGIENSRITGHDEKQLALARLGDAGGHAGFKALGPGGAGGLRDAVVYPGAERGTIDKGAFLGVAQKVVGSEEERLHGGIVGDHCENNLGLGGDNVRVFGGVGLQFLGHFGGETGNLVIHRGDPVTLIVEAAGHVGAHATESDNPDGAFLDFHGQKHWSDSGGISRTKGGNPRNPAANSCTGAGQRTGSGGMRPWNYPMRAAALVAALAMNGIPQGGSPAVGYSDPTRFVPVIADFMEADKQFPPPKGAVLCIGSSSMRMWHETIAADLAPLTVIPRGFGGSTFWDLLQYLERVVLPYEPRAIVVYEGDNDIAGGASPVEIVETFRRITARVHARLPECRFYVLSIKPSLRRMEMWPAMQEANRLLEAECRADARLVYVDVAGPMLQEDGSVKEDIFLSDGLHMNAKGYAIWRDVLRPVLLEQELAGEADLLLWEDFEDGFGDGLAGVLQENSFIEAAPGAGRDGSDGIRVTYQGYEQGSERVVALYPLDGHAESVRLHFDVRFEPDFQFVKGGKLHGVGPARRVTGGRPRVPEGWSSRIMFQDEGHVSTYFYDQDVEKLWGAGNLSAEAVFLPGHWHHVELETMLNTPGEADGLARIRVDGREVVRSEGVEFRGTGGPETLIQKFLFSTFHGGNTPEWAPVDKQGKPTTVYAWFDNFAVVRIHREAGQ